MLDGARHQDFYLWHICKLSDIFQVVIDSLLNALCMDRPQTDTLLPSHSLSFSPVFNPEQSESHECRGCLVS